ncbi:hypothetical protein CHARACLAT_016148 [Characodon lateralis]|uniref:Uncharacterized protein n=1 Tax=Characodon lateralis TaxID=208331 RepID=A0ABU7EBY4_9TELE|nr:hypothetical protein [Characodon lateralis]
MPITAAYFLSLSEARTLRPSSARSLWETMLTSKHKEAVMEVRRHLVEAATKEKLPIKMSMGRVTPEQLCSYAKLFRSNWEALESHCGVLQLGLATAQMLRHPSLARWDSCLAFERLLLQVCAHLTQPYYPEVTHYKHLDYLPI